MCQDDGVYPIFFALTAFRVLATARIAVAFVTGSLKELCAKRLTDNSPVCLARDFNLRYRTRSRPRTRVF
jgi:hypothetical protein